MTTTRPAPKTAAGPPRPRSPRGEGDRLRGEILAAAEDLLAEAGDPDALTLRGIAKRVGIAAPSAYRHFPDLDHLKQAVVERAFARFAAARDSAGAQDADPGTALLARCRAYCRFALENPGAYRFMFSSPGPRTLANAPGDRGPAERNPARDAFAALARSISLCQRAGLAHADADPAYLAAQVWPALHGLALLHLNAPDFPWPAGLEQMADFAVARLVGLPAPHLGQAPSGQHAAPGTPGTLDGPAPGAA